MNKQQLVSLYDAQDIAKLWQEARNKAVIHHPQYGWISPNAYRAKYAGKPCPLCGQKMVHGQDIHSTLSRREAIRRGYGYNVNGETQLNQTGDRYFHPHYVSLDHKLNKARFPDKMFDPDNLQVMCWKCNNLKGDNNAYELQHTFDYIDDLAHEGLKRYTPL
ncbi:MAG: HNH endonuclease [Cyanothece sp. SIO2G6]|nr:HNH endonuclease [Cyanothece sp. SIO2G6]